MVFERELWRIAVENLPWVDQHAWAALAGARVASNNWRRAKAMLQFDRSGELRKRFLLTCLQRNRNTQLRLRALGEIPELRDPDAFTEAVDLIGTWSREEQREGVKVLLGALAERQVGRRDQAASWIWDLAGYTHGVHEDYAAQRWPETKHLLGLLVNSSGAAHGRNARRYVHAARNQDRRLCAALLAAAMGHTHTPEATQVLTGARTRMARKPSALARELLRNFPKGRRRRGGRRRRRSEDGGGPEVEHASTVEDATAEDGSAAETEDPAAAEDATAEDGAAPETEDAAAAGEAAEGVTASDVEEAGAGREPAEAA